MKKQIFLILFILCKLTLLSQITAVTPKIGVTLSNAQDFNGMQYKLGYLIGTSIEYKLSQKIVFKPEIKLAQKGTKQKGYLTDENGFLLPDSKSYISYNYLNLPILMEYHPLSSNHIFLSGGPYIGYLLKSTQRTITTWNGEKYDSKMNLDMSNYNLWDVGFCVGGGINIPFLKKGEIKIDLLYEYALSIVNQKQPPRTNTFSLSTGYKIRLGN